jgi:hypothetical protein
MNNRILRSGGLLFFFAIALWAASDPFTGTWKLNLAKSNPAAVATFKSITAKIESLQNGLKVIEDLVSAQGMPTRSEFSAKYDGLDYPVTGDPYFDSISLTRADANHGYAIWKKAGRIAATAQNVISPDGKTWTETIATKDAQGGSITIVAVFDKQ